MRFVIELDKKEAAAWLHCRQEGECQSCLAYQDRNNCTLNAMPLSKIVKQIKKQVKAKHLQDST